ncbi:plasmid stabilization protein StbA [Escherichia coli]|uniref:plasmid stabilization protein StbA n=1 Tax=Escherichia coli TaxID=562 RepID=UPI0013623C47|nr:plasmid stabilization protein StbA [Escherichia coli]
MNKPADLKPRNLSAAVRLRLDEIENWLDRGITRHEIAEILGSEYSFSVTAKGLEMALYRARQNRKSVLHNTQDSKPDDADSVLHNTQGKSSAKGTEESVLHNTQPSGPEAQESEKVESPGIIDKEFFNKIGEDFDPKKFNKKF